MKKRSSEEQIIKFLREVEGFRLDSYCDPEGIPTIGVGINLQVSGNLDAVLEVLGFDVSGTILTGAALEADLNYIQQIRDAVNIVYVPNDDSFLDMTLNNILAARRADTQYVGSFVRREFFQFNDEIEAQTAFNAIIGQYETQLDDWLASNGIAAIGPSRERTALISLTFNNAGALLGPKLAAALQIDDRAEAFYEIAYNSNGGGASQGIANRRYREADLFGMYNDAPDEADYQSAYRMYTRHKETILGADGVLGGADGYEDNFPPPEAGMGILDQLAPARDFLVQKYVVDELGLPASTIDGDVLVGQDVTFTQVGSGAQTWSLDDDLTGTDAGDLMLGGEGADTLRGGAGSDVLYGDSGNDFLHRGRATTT